MTDLLSAAREEKPVKLIVVAVVGAFHLRCGEFQTYSCPTVLGYGTKGKAEMVAPNRYKAFQSTYLLFASFSQGRG